MNAPMDAPTVAPTDAPTVAPTGRSVGFPPWYPREQASLFGVEATAQRLGRAVWLDERLFEIVGGWITSVPEAELRERLAAHCHRHAAHAALFRERLPQATGVDGRAMVASPGPGIDDAVSLLASATDTLPRLVGLYRVFVPHLVSAHGFHRHATNSVTDGPTAAALDTAVAGLVSQWRDGEMMIETILQRAAADAPTALTAALATAAQHQAAIESAIVAAGGVLGPGTLG